MYLQIDAILKQLDINRDSECSGLLLCNLHYQSTSSILLRDLSEITTVGGGVLWRHQEFAIRWSVNSDLANLPKRCATFCQVLHFVNSYKNKFC